MKWLSEVRELVEEPARTSADRLLSNFFDVLGTPIDPAICFYANRSPTARLNSDEVSFVRTHCFLLTLAGMAENTYMHHAFEPLNATHGERIFMNFEAAAGPGPMVRRRREGWGQSPWRSAGLKSHKPIAAEGRPTATGEHPGILSIASSWSTALRRASETTAQPRSRSSSRSCRSCERTRWTSTELRMRTSSGSNRARAADGPGVGARGRAPRKRAARRRWRAFRRALDEGPRPPLPPLAD